jgi:signal transduction histidine kinase
VEPEPEDARRELDELRDDLDRAREQLTLLAGQVGHELRTPLTAILANAEMLGAELDARGDDDLRWMVDAMARAARRLEQMIDAMVAYARQGGEPSLGVTAVGRVFEAALADLQSVVTEKRAVVTLGELPVLPADADHLYAVAWNLLSNALRFSRPGVPPQVVVAAERVDDRWRIRVSDDGVGVPEERREAMFALFARGDRRVDSSGIGLAVARRLVEGHGGRIGLTGSDTGGTTAWFELPA